MRSNSSSEHEGEEGPPRQLGDEAELFAAYNDKLVNRIDWLVRTSRSNVEDACAHAWAQFLRYQPDRNGNWRGWLFSTAQREAWRLHALEVEHDHLGSATESGPVRWTEPEDARDQYSLHMDLDEAMEALSRVPERRRRVKLLAVLGFRYEDIGRLTGDSVTRVNQLMTEANMAVRRERAQMQGERFDPRSERAKRLAELEQQPPDWLVRMVGRPPGLKRNASQLQAWRRAALAIDDYRRLHGPRSGVDPLGDRPHDERAARAYDLASTAISRFRSALDVSRSLDR